MVESISRMKRLVKEVDRLRRWQQYMIDRLQVGSGTTDASGDASVTFPKPYSSAPKVFLQGVDASSRGIVLDVVSKTATGFTVKARKVTGLPTGSALKGMHYHTASAVTGIPTSTGSALGSHSHTVDPHNHSIGSPSTTSVLVGMHYHHGAVAAKYDHKHEVAHIVDSVSWTDPTARDDYDFYYSDGSACHHVYTGSSAVGIVGDLYTLTPTATQDVVTDLYTESTDWTTVVTGIPSATGSSGSTTSSVDLAHTHSIGAASTGTFVTSLVIASEDWLTVVTGDPVVANVDFDWLAILP